MKNCILGYTIGNDVGERNWQASDRTSWRAKNADISVNGEQTTSFETADMLFGIEEFISTMSRYLTLHPGDVIWMGTDGSSPDLQPGDRVDVTLTGLGTLSNTFVKGDLT